MGLLISIYILSCWKNEFQYYLLSRLHLSRILEVSTLKISVGILKRLRLILEEASLIKLFVRFKGNWKWYLRFESSWKLFCWLEFDDENYWKNWKIFFPCYFHLRRNYFGLFQKWTDIWNSGFWVYLSLFPTMKCFACWKEKGSIALMIGPRAFDNPPKSPSFPVWCSMYSQFVLIICMQFYELEFLT